MMAMSDHTAVPPVSRADYERRWRGLGSDPYGDKPLAFPHGRRKPLFWAVLAAYAALLIGLVAVLLSAKSADAAGCRTERDAEGQCVLVCPAEGGWLAG
jgi:hypothetical protein